MGFVSEEKSETRFCPRLLRCPTTPTEPQPQHHDRNAVTTQILPQLPTIPIPEGLWGVYHGAVRCAHAPTGCRTNRHLYRASCLIERPPRWVRKGGPPFAQGGCLRGGGLGRCCGVPPPPQRRAMPGHCLLPRPEGLPMRPPGLEGTVGTQCHRGWARCLDDFVYFLENFDSEKTAETMPGNHKSKDTTRHIKYMLEIIKPDFRASEK